MIKVIGGKIILNSKLKGDMSDWKYAFEISNITVAENMTGKTVIIDGVGEEFYVKESFDDILATIEAYRIFNLSDGKLNSRQIKEYLKPLKDEAQP